MPQYAQFISNSTSPCPVIGWYDTDKIAYPTLPSTENLFQVNAVQWAARIGKSSNFAVNTTTDPFTLEPWYPAPPVLSLATQAQIALANGITITSSSNSTLNGTYDVSSSTQQHINAEVTSILLNGVFADGTSSVIWLDTSNASHTFNVVEFKAFASAIASYVAALLKVIQGTLTTLPSSSVTIA